MISDNGKRNTGGYKYTANVSKFVSIIPKLNV